MNKAERREYRKAQKRKKRENNKLLELHRRVFRNYLNTQTGLGPSDIMRVLGLYNTNISWANIQHFYYRSMEIFHNALITDRLEEIKDYFEQEKEVTHG